jgi:hypothetical protein
MNIIPALDLSDLSGIRVYGEELLIPTSHGYDWNDERGWRYWRTMSQGRSVASLDADGLHAQIQRGDRLILDILLPPNNRARIWQANDLALNDDERTFIVWALAHRLPEDVACEWADEL